MAEIISSDNNQSRVANIVPTIANYQKLISAYKKRISSGEFHEEPIGEDFFYPDW